MEQNKKQKILVSACLLGINCKYDGTNNEDEGVIKYLKDKEIIPICPEQLGGLSTPRIPSERRNGQVITKKGNIVTENYKKGAIEVLNLAKKLNIKRALLKSKSPSCGKEEIYDGSFSHTLIKRPGVTTELLLKHGIEVISSDEL